MGPIRYDIDVESPFKAALQGFQAGASIKDVLDQRTLAEQQRQAQEQARAQMHQDLATLTSKPNVSASEYAALVLRYPQLKDQFKQSWDAMSAERRQSKQEHGSRAYAAIQAGRPDIAEQLFRDRAAAARNSGAEEDAKQAETMAELIKLNPGMARTTVATSLASLDPEKFAETFGKLGDEQRAAELQPGLVRKGTADADKAVADATTAGVGAKFAESNAIKDLEKKGWDIQALQADIGFKREANRIALINAQISRETNQLKRKELGLKLQEARNAMDTKVRERTAEFETGQATLQDALNLLTELRADPDTLAAATGASAWRGAIPGTKSRTAAGKIEQLQNALAASNLDKLKGAMSDKDIAFLKNIATNLDRYQDEDQFLAELGKIEQTLVRADKQMRQKFGAPKREAPSVEPAATGTVQRNVTVDW